MKLFKIIIMIFSTNQYFFHHIVPFICPFTSQSYGEMHREFLKWPFYLPFHTKLTNMVGLFVCPFTWHVGKCMGNFSLAIMFTFSYDHFSYWLRFLEPWKWSHLGQQHKGPLANIKQNSFDPSCFDEVKTQNCKSFNPI